MFGPCKVCVSKDARIADLKNEIDHLRSLIFPPQAPLLPSVAIQADAILGGEPQSAAEAQEAIDREASLIFSGNLE